VALVDRAFIGTVRPFPTQYTSGILFRVEPTPASASALLLPTPRPRRAVTAFFHRGARAFTLVEVLIATVVLSLLALGVLAMIIQSRRLTEGSIVQNSVVTVMQGYIEQCKSMEYSLLVPSASTAPATPLTLPTVLDEVTPDALTLSWGTPPTTLPALGTTPTGAVDNTKIINIKNPVVNPSDRVTLTIWVWVQDLTDIAHNVGGCRSVTMIYTYQFRDGSRLRSTRSSIRTVRSVVPSF
jgi:prepilin-type N-terminal cleavage/methylation domain-containing protein